MPSWDDFKELVLIDKKDVCNTIKSFYFKSKNGEKLPKHIPGQFLPFKIKTNDPEMKDVIRTYSLSDFPNDEIYRISVKKIDGGLMSSYLHDRLQIGDCIEAMPPVGEFVLDENLPKDSPIVLLSGGIGITPLLSIFLANAQDRNIQFVQAVQNSKIHPFGNDINNICKKYNLKNTVFYSNPLDTDKLGEDYDVEGFVTKEWLKYNVPLNSTFYFCGPPIFMESLENNLLSLGVPKDKINYEKFS